MDRRHTPGRPHDFGGSSSSAPNRCPTQRFVYEQLLAGFQSGEGQGPEARWPWLEAAHVVAQMDLRLHWDSHRRMLAYAIERRDWPESAGQVFRLALVPLGHAFGRLPPGNIGRATVNAFRPMEVGSPVRELMERVHTNRAHEPRSSVVTLPQP